MSATLFMTTPTTTPPAPPSISTNNRRRDLVLMGAELNNKSTQVGIHAGQGSKVTSKKETYLIPATWDRLRSGVDPEPRNRRS